jgi:DNA primase
VAAFIPDHILEQVRQSNDIVDVVGSYFPLKRAGANFRALCPFHKEKTPSFNVSPARQIWHCFGCGAGGDVFKFVMQYENLDFAAAVRRLAERAGIRIELVEKAGDQDSRDQRDALLRLHEGAAAFFQDLLLKDKAAGIAREYLKKRQISQETAKRWRLGYSPDAWDGLIQWAKAKKFPVGLMEAAGLVLRREGGEGYYDRFRGRLMFPICDEQGRPVGFSGRILTDAKDQPKYVNSPETPIFQKGKVLFALDKAKRAILDEKFAIVCEGQLDAISCHEAGMANVVAPQGTALTEQHARILKRYAEEVVLMFDADEAGQNAIVRSAEPLWQAALPVRVAALPAGHDPDSFVKANGAAALGKLVANAPSFFVFLLERLSKQYDPGTDRGKLKISQGAMQWLARVPSPILQASYVQQVAGKLGVPEEAMRRELANARSRLRTGQQPGAAEEEPSRGGTRGQGTAAELMLLQLILADERSAALASERLQGEWLTPSVAGELVGRVLKLIAGGKWAGADAAFMARLDAEAGKLVSELLMRPAPKDAGKAVEDCVNTLERHWAEREMERLRCQQRRPGISAQESGRLTQQVLDLKLRLGNIGAPAGEKSKVAKP